jgi:hypothetical protein
MKWQMTGITQAVLVILVAQVILAVLAILVAQVIPAVLAILVVLVILVVPAILDLAEWFVMRKMVVEWSSMQLDNSLVRLSNGH